MHLTRALGLAVAACGLLRCGTAPARADFVLDRQIDRLSPTTTSVDYVPFTVTTPGTVTIDILSWEADLFSELPVDVNGDGEIAFFDAVIYLFHDDGTPAPGELIDANDDSTATFADGSISALDSYLSVALPAGDYILATGAFFLSLGDAISGVNGDALGGGLYPITFTGGPLSFGTSASAVDHGDYRVTVTGGVIPVPVPGAALLAMIGFPMIGWARRRLP